MRGLRVFPFLLAAVLCVLSSTAYAVTLDQVVALKKAGVTDAVILALIERDQTVFSIQPEQIVALQRDGLSEALIVAMLKSGQAGEEAARAESAYKSAMIAATLSPAPDVLIVGHGPERPNTAHYDGFFTDRSPLYFVPPVYGIPPVYGVPPAYDVPSIYDVPSLSSGRYAAPYVKRGVQRTDRWMQPRELCYAQMSTSTSGSKSLSFVTECPAVMQPQRLR